MSSGLKMQKGDVFRVLDICEAIAGRRVFWQESSAVVVAALEFVYSRPELLAASGAVQAMTDARELAQRQPDAATS